MYVLYEDSGSFKVGTILADSEASLQIEALHGKRAKIKSKDVLLRFENPSASELLTQAEAIAREIDTEFLWQCCGTEEFDFEQLAREYCGRAPSAIDAAGILVKLHSEPVYFHRKGRGRFRASAPETLRAALAGIERRRQVEQQIDAWTEQLETGAFPAEFISLIGQLLYKPDRNRPETKAMEKVCQKTALSPAKLLQRCGVLPSSHDYHLNRFLFDHFPKGIGFPENIETAVPSDLPIASVEAFSLDDETTTEIDDAFSLTRLDSSRLRIGIHIAVPALGLEPGSVSGAIARERLSTVYMPGDKITMLPPRLIERFTLAEGRDCPAISLYLDVRESDFAVENRHTCVERVRIAANLRHHVVETLDAAFLGDQVTNGIPYASELKTLWRCALVLEQGRGKNASGTERAEYTFRVIGERIAISERRRGTPLDKLVAELMIAVNSTWGKLLDDHGVAAIYRTQSSGKVRMTTSPGPHHGLGITHYAWSSSPLRRYVDLVNQWQLLSLLDGSPPRFERNADAMLSAIHDFEATYAQYDEFQRHMERYWCLRWLLQEKIDHTAAEVLRDNLVKFDRLPLYVKVPSLPELSPGSRVELAIANVDLIDTTLECRFMGRLDIP